MTGIIHFETFLVAGILLNLTPGNDTIFILTKSIAQGRKAGILSVAGIATGSLIHTTLAALGLSIIIAKSIVAFTIVKYAGAVYLLYIGFKMIFERTLLGTEIPLKAARSNPLKIYRDAVLTNVLNPKVAMFFIAFLPQFIDPSYQNSILPFMLLGITFTITGTLWCLVLANFSAYLFARLRDNKRFAGYLNKISGAVLIALGIRIAFTSREQ
ncbi:MAG TPA: LysE family translocator [Chitinophagaceae bacterium]|nr:LysE family translocator [Chitinophagaceae bacterium]